MKFPSVYWIDELTNRIWKFHTATVIHLCEVVHFVFVQHNYFRWKKGVSVSLHHLGSMSISTQVKSILAITGIYIPYNHRLSVCCLREIGADAILPYAQTSPQSCTIQILRSIFVYCNKTVMVWISINLLVQNCRFLDSNRVSEI